MKHSPPDKHLSKQNYENATRTYARLGFKTGNPFRLSSSSVYQVDLKTGLFKMENSKANQKKRHLDEVSLT